MGVMKMGIVLLGMGDESQEAVTIGVRSLFQYFTTRIEKDDFL